MTATDDLAVIFEEQRTRLRAVAYRPPGSVHEADDAVQETPSAVVDPAFGVRPGHSSASARSPRLDAARTRGRLSRVSEPQYRAQFDATVTFSNGGGLRADGFRVDVPGPDTGEEQVAALFVASLGLLMVDRVELHDLRVFPEPHKGTRGGPSATGNAPVDGGGWRYVELNHVITPGMTTYPGLPGPEITPHLTREASRRAYAEGTEFAIDRISMLGNTGTYVDSPFHRYPEGSDLAGLPLETLVDLPAVVVRTVGSAGRAVDVGALAALEVRGCAVLLHTGGDVGWGTDDYDRDAPYLTGAGARWLVGSGARLVGIDSVNIDDIGDPSRPAHTVLLAAGVPVVEHLTGLGHLPPLGARFTAAPPRVAGLGTFPVRAFAAVPAASPVSST